MKRDERDERDDCALADCPEIPPSAVPPGCIPLADICRSYFGLGYEEARRKAALHELPVPAFRLTDSRKSPLVVAITDLRQYVNERAEVAREQWKRSQV